MRTSASPTGRLQSQAPLPLWMLYPVFFAGVYFSHLTLLRLPYFWDEAGYYIPAAWDFFKSGTLIPRTTMTNAHPPLPSILLAAWWHLSGFVPSGTRTLVCMVSAAALLGVFRIARGLLGTSAAVATTIMTGVYSIWFAQSTLAHADIFAAAFTLWALSYYFERFDPAISSRPISQQLWTAALFSLACMAKETAIITPAALASWELWLVIRDRNSGPERVRLTWIAALLFPALPLIGWYAYHYLRTGFVFGNPDFLRYNATANFDLQRIALCMYHRLLHLTAHMNLFVPVLSAIAVLLLPGVTGRRNLPRAALNAVLVILTANWIAFSVLGGALLTRYLLPMYPLVLLLCVAAWRSHFLRWDWLAILSTAALGTAIWVNAPYAFAPEDNLTYRDFVLLHDDAVSMIANKWPQATVLTAWPATSELERPELGYTKKPIKAFAIQNFSIDEIEKAAQEPGEYDTALLFSTKLIPPPSRFRFGRGDQPSDARYFDFRRDVRPDTAAAILHGQVVWQAAKGNEWVAILRFPRVFNAELQVR